jgi:TPR repeat protein
VPAAEPKPAPASPAPPSNKPLAVGAFEGAALKGLISKGQQQLELGNVVVARQFLKRATDSGSAEAALLMGDTYEKGALARLGAIGIAPDPVQAQRWYAKARDLGAAETAAKRLERLKSK